MSGVASGHALLRTLDVAGAGPLVPLCSVGKVSARVEAIERARVDPRGEGEELHLESATAEVGAQPCNTPQGSSFAASTTASGIVFRDVLGPTSEGLGQAGEYFSSCAKALSKPRGAHRLCRK